jgi:hypothetical protein
MSDDPRNPTQPAELLHGAAVLHRALRVLDRNLGDGVDPEVSIQRAVSDVRVSLADALDEVAAKLPGVLRLFATNR